MDQLTKRQKAVLKIIEGELKKSGVLPTLGKIAEKLGVSSKNGIAGHIRALEKKGKRK